MKDFNIIVIGGGSAGFAAAIRGAELGKKVALIESSTIGGTCVNIGCVPSKFIINGAFSNNSWENIKVERDKLVESLRNEKYMNVLKSYPENISYFPEKAEFKDTRSIILTNGETLTADNYIVATGSRPYFPDIPGIYNIDPMNSTDLLFTENLPKSLIIVGGRFITLELGQAFAKLGVDVTIVQRSRSLIPQYDSEIGSSIERIFKDQGITVITGTQLIDASVSGKGKTLKYSLADKQSEISAEQIVFATGRRGNTESLNLSAAGVETDSLGHVVTNKYLQTANPIVFAAGDVLESPGLVYVAAKEGGTAVQNAYTTLPDALEYNNVPEVIFTHPQIARVGITGSDSQTKDIRTLSSRFSISETPYGLANKVREGIVKLLINADNRQILGAEILSPDAGNMIQTITVAIRARLTVEDIKDTYFPYLTAIEGVKLSAVVFDKDIKMLSCCAN